MILHLPTPVLCSAMADRFLVDQDVRSFAISCKATLHSMQQYNIKQNLPIDVALRCEQLPVILSSQDGLSLSLWFGRVRGVTIGGPSQRPPPVPFNPFAPPTAALLPAKTTDKNPPLTLECLQQQLDALPAGVERLRTGYTFNLAVDGLRLPKSLRSLHFGEQFNQRLNLLELPVGIKQLHISDHWDRPVEQLPTLLEGLQQLVFGHRFNQPLTGLRLPNSLLVIEFGDCFNQPVEKLLSLPPQLQALRFGMYFNQPVERLPLPASLTQLHLSFSFSYPLRKWSPPAALTDLVLGCQWNLSPTDLLLPTGLCEFQLPVQFQPEADDIELLSLPSGLTNLQFGSTWAWPCPARWVKQACEVYSSLFDKPLQSMRFPPALQRLHLGYFFDRPLSGTAWSSSLTHLILSARFSQPILQGDLPKTLQIFDMSCCRMWSYPLHSHLYLTPNIQKFMLPCSFNQLLSLPASGWAPSLTSLHLGTAFDQPLLEWTAPPNLLELTLSDMWNLPVSQLRLPNTLVSLTFKGVFDQPVDQLELPSSLRVLRFAGVAFNQCVNSLCLPAGLEVLQLGSDLKWDRRNLGHFNQPLDKIKLPSSLQILCLPTFAFQQPKAALPHNLPPSLRVLHLHSPNRLESSGWEDIRLPPQLEVEYGEPLHCRCTLPLPD